MPSRPLLRFHFAQPVPPRCMATFRPASFHTYLPRAASSHDEPSHYEILNVHELATRAEIKKRFYELSKIHHPDRNRNDQHASKRFVKISGAYSILSNPRSRERYDLELQRLRPSRPKASHSNPVGGRPASGLSRRRTQPHGPPPSFYRNTGWSSFRRKNPEGRVNSTGVYGGGMGAGGPASADKHDVPHFNWDNKYRQHEFHEQRKSKRRPASSGPIIDPGIIIPFIAVASILAITVSTGAFGKGQGKKTSRE